MMSRVVAGVKVVLARMVRLLQSGVEGAASMGHSQADFLPAAVTLDSDRAVPAARLVVWLSCGFLVSVLVWATFASADKVVTAEGKVRPAAKVQVINHPRGGRIAAILVEAGEHVEAGQALVRLDPVLLTEELNKLRPRRLTLLAEIARLEAERDRLKGPVFPDAVTEERDLVETQRELFAERIAGHAEQQRALRAAVEQRKRAIKQYEARADYARRGLALAEKQARAVDTLAEKGYFPKLRAMQVHRDVTAVLSEVAQSEELAASASAALASDEAKLAQFDRDIRAEVLSAISEKRSQLAEAEATMNQVQDQLARLELTSPVSGFVEELRVTTSGQALGEGAEIMHIVPDGDNYVIEVAVRNADIAFIRPDQSVHMKFRAYDYQRYGTLAGTVVDVATDSRLDERRQEHFFTVRVAPAASYLGHNEAHRMRSGMIADVDFHVGHRTVLSYLLDTIARTRDEALRE